MTLFDKLFVMGFDEFGKRNYQLSLDCLKLAHALNPDDDCTTLFIKHVECAKSLQERADFWKMEDET